jgi:nitrite reductase/ring-hydroxylating ferredoxin subunit
MTDPAVASRTLGSSRSVSEGEIEPFYLADRKLRIAVARVDGRLFAFDDLCTCSTQPCPLSGGLLTGTVVMCQCHGSEFDNASGNVRTGPATRPLTTYPVRETEGDIDVMLPPGLAPAEASHRPAGGPTRRALSAAAAVAATVATVAGIAGRTRRTAAPTITPVGVIARGAAAGVVGTLAFDVWLYLQYRREHGTEAFADWEFSADVAGWDNAPAPAQVGRRIINGLFETELPDSRARLINNIAHWAYGLSGATAYGVVAGSLRRPRVGYGLILGAAMWLSGYVILPPMHLYKRITEYDAKTLGKDLAAHLVYGTTTGAIFALLRRR